MKKIVMILALMLGGLISLSAQVTIGSGEKPNRGALLDLKEEETDRANASRGLLLPRVEMSTTQPKVGKLAQSIGATGTWDEAEHTGLIVYNAKNTLDACKGGAYVDFTRGMARNGFLYIQRK